jgi:hypothetical protein
LVERKVVALVVEAMKEKKLTQVEVAGRAFPDKAKPTRKFQQIVKASRIGVP